MERVANRYKRVKIKGRMHYVHRLIWEAAYGPIPDGHHVHHVNHDPQDNRLENLELLSKPDHARRHASEPKLNGRWSLTHDACRECGRSDRKHAAMGLCKTCYMRGYYHAKIKHRVA